MKDDAVYLRHILECIRRVEEHVAVGHDVFLASHTLQDATRRNLQTMVEASQRLSEHVKSTQPQLEWRQIAAFRNLLVHNYLGLDMEQMWTIIQQDLPPLKQAVSVMLDALA